jgi:alpha-D-ribose 1-methylphosphonate 5-triphosphate synthase subunit PhnH
LLIGALAAAALSLPGGATGEPAPSFFAVVGPDTGFAISLKDASGNGVSRIDPGTYVISVDDQATIHNFHLRGPGVDQRTDIAETGMTQWTVTFQNGTYTYLCDAHPVNMKRTFTVGDVAPPSPVKLIGKVTSRAISLTQSSGGKVKSIFAGSYKVTVSDRSKKQNFHLRGPGVNRKTAVGRIVKATWTLNLKPGKYTYRSDKSRKLRGSFNVTAKPTP